MVESKGGSDDKNLPTIQEIQVQSLGRVESLKKGMATHSSFLTWRILWTEEPGGLEPMVSKESDMTEELTQKSKHRMFNIMSEL